MKKFQPGPLQRIRDVSVGKNVVIADFVNLYECQIGDDSCIGHFVEIGKGVVIGRHCSINSHAYICPGVTIEDEVYVGERTSFINDLYPRATNDSGAMATEADWILRATLVKRAAVIEAGAVILCDLIIGIGARIKAGSVVTEDVPDGATVAGNPACIVS